MERSELLMRCVISVISDDYENLETTMNQARSLADSEDLSNVSEVETLDALERAVVEGYAEAYELSAYEPHAKKREFDRNRVDDLRFYATQKGKAAARNFRSP